MAPQVQPKCFWHVQHMIKKLTIEKMGLSHQVWSHGGSTLNRLNSRPAQTDPYMYIVHCLMLTFLLEVAEISFPGLFDLNLAYSKPNLHLWRSAPRCGSTPIFLLALLFSERYKHNVMSVLTTCGMRVWGSILLNIGTISSPSSFFIHKMCIC